MKVTAMESARRRLHDQATQRGRARAVQTGAEQKESQSRVWAIIRMGDNWGYKEDSTLLEHGTPINPIIAQTAENQQFAVVNLFVRT